MAYAHKYRLYNSGGPSVSGRQEETKEDVTSKAEIIENNNCASVLDIAEDCNEEDVFSEAEIVENNDAPAVDIVEDIFIPNGRPKRGRKRKFPEQSRQDRKRLYNNNETHINSKGNFVEQKIFDEHFWCGCRKQCIEKVPLTLRKRLFTQFCSMGTYAGRCVLLISCVSNRDNTSRYTYSIYGHVVCKNGLIGLLQINESRLKLALGKYANCDKYADGRGSLSGGRNAHSLFKKTEVRAHINSFPRYVSHYTRSQTESKFLNTNLNLAKIYRLYRNTTENPVSMSVYKRIFYQEFNLRFKPPKKDTCKKCDLYKVKIQNADDPTRRMPEEWHNSHIEMADSLKKQMKKDLEDAKTNENLETLTYDMQKTLPLPRLTTSIAYYKRQLNFYNFGIHQGSTCKGIFNVWQENEASKGTQEVGSCLKFFIENNITDPVKNLILWSDSCGGQNRSIKLVLMLICVLQNHESVTSISLRYLETGHTFLPNDTEFGDVECELKSNQNLFTDKAYIQIMLNCRQRNRFEVNRMSPQYFFSVKKIQDAITNRKTDTQKNKVNWLATHEVLLEKDHPYIIKMRKTINGEFQSVDLSKGRCGTRIHLKNIELDTLWPTGQPLSQEKVADLKSMLELVPDEDKHFYKFLEDTTTHVFIDDVDGFGEVIDFEIEDPE